MTFRKKPGNGEALAEFHRLRSIETDDCVLWPFSCDTRGYGQLRYEQRVRKVHQLALELLESRPAGAVACHVAGIGCQRRCMNVRHLYWGTQAQNATDRLTDGTSRRGVNVPGARLTDADVIAIRSQYAAGGVMIKDIATDYSVSASTISDIVRRRRWAWLNQP